MAPTITQEALADLLQRASHKHHAAYIEADGIDPEWALWYAGYIQAHLWDEAGRLPTRSELVYLFVKADRAYIEAGVEEPWPRVYARLILDALG
jgi:NAD(P)H-hydrate epimerase